LIVALDEDSYFSELWGTGSNRAAESLMELWSSAIAMVLFKNEPNQPEVIAGIVHGIAGLVFDSDVEKRHQ